MPTSVRHAARRAETKLSGTQAQYVLGRLVAHGVVSARDIEFHLRHVQQEIGDLEARLQLLRAARPHDESASHSRPVRHLSPERRAALVKQGQYLSMIRQIPRRKRAQFSAIAKTRGTSAAIVALKRELEV